GSPGIEDSRKFEAHLTSAAAFVEGGIQDACDDACSICLEAFCDNDPSTIWTLIFITYLLAEVCRREIEANIKPDLDIYVYMIISFVQFVLLMGRIWPLVVGI
ncbi:hypothetical protein S83_016170, partial [Arachis hypogaea]